MNINPSPMARTLTPGGHSLLMANPSQRGSHYIEGIGRLKKGVTVEQAREEMNALMTQLGREHPDDQRWKVLVVPLDNEIVGSSRRLLLVLLGAVGMVLFIACANAANLLLASASTRQREISVRLALGAPRSRVVRQLLTESLLISFVGGGIGLALALVGVKALVSLLPANFPRAHDIHVSAPVFVFTLAVSVVTGILFGLAPALQASRTDPNQGLHKGGRATTGSGHQSRLRNALVVSEVGLACVLLIGAGLMLRSLLNIVHLDPGFKQDHVLTASLSLPHTEYKTQEDSAKFVAQLVTSLESLPGVQSAGLGSDLPWTGYDDNTGFNIEGKQPPPHEDFHARYHMATADYFRALGTPLLQGRFFNEGDKKDAPAVIIINHALAQRYCPGEDVVGKRITFEDNPKDKDWLTIVGVVGDVKDQPNSPGAEPAFWWSALQVGAPNMSIWWFAPTQIRIADRCGAEECGPARPSSGRWERSADGPDCQRLGRHAALCLHSCGTLRRTGYSACRYRHLWRDLLFRQPADAGVWPAHGTGRATASMFCASFLFRRRSLCLSGRCWSHRWPWSSPAL